MYRLAFKLRAESGLEDLDTTIRVRVFAKLQYLCENCDEHRHKALKGSHSGKFSLKVGTYRALYTFSKRDREITVHEIGHRSKIY